MPLWSSAPDDLGSGAIWGEGQGADGRRGQRGDGGGLRCGWGSAPANLGADDHAYVHGGACDDGRDQPGWEGHAAGVGERNTHAPPPDDEASTPASCVQALTRAAERGVSDG